MAETEATNQSNAMTTKTNVAAAGVRVEVTMVVRAGDQAAVAHLGTIVELVYRVAIEY